MADSQPSKNTKRRLRAPAQTVRQKAEKAQAEAQKPESKRRLRTAAATVRKPFGRATKIFDRQPFRTIGKVFTLLGRIILPKFIRNAFGELKYVTWPGRKETRQLTFAVLMFAVVFGIVVTALDYGLDKLFRALILK